MIKSTKTNTNFAAQVTILTSKSQFFMINFDESDYYQMFISMAFPSCYIIKLKHAITPIVVTLLSLTNFILIYSYSLRALSDNVLIWLNGRPLASLISFPQISLYLQPNAFKSFVQSLILYSQVSILHIMALYTLIKISFKSREIILLLLPTLLNFFLRHRALLIISISWSSTMKQCISLTLYAIMYNERLIEKMMRYFLSTSNIDKIDLCVANIEVYFCCLAPYIGQKHFNIWKLLCLCKSCLLFK